MFVRAAAGVAGVLWMGVVVWAQQSAPPAAPRPPLAAAMSDADQNALVAKYCASCHSQTGKSGNLTLEGFNASSPFLSADLLEKLIRKLRVGQMPPANAKRPADAELTAFTEALETKSDALIARTADPGWRPIPRLNRAEYARVVKDVLALDIDASAILPPDTASGGFDNIADAQAASPAVMSAFLRGAAAISSRAMASPQSRARILTCNAPSADTETACARTTLRRLVDAAYRGQANDSDLSDLLAFYKRGRADGSFDDGIRLALQAILVSPKFIFRVETADGAGVLSDLAIASRLSFFLWSSGPDQLLISAAKRGELRTPAQVVAQAMRMLRDPRAESLSTRFASQWLRLQDLDKNVVDRAKFPSFDPALSKDMRRETELFVQDIIRRDANVMELVTSSRSFMNERVARHYGISSVRGSAFRAVDLPASRRGVLGQGSVLTLTSLGTRTSPVLRGKWVLDVLLGAPPPPPPPNVPALEDSTKAEKDGVALTTRQRVEEHRRNPQCASCHRVIDPSGMALENFDAVGAWRVLDNGAPIDASADFFDGRRIDGLGGLTAALTSRQEAVLRNFTHQLMTYAVGRRLTYRDMPTVRSIVRAAGSKQNRFSVFIAGIVASDAFRMTKPPKER